MNNRVHQQALNHPNLKINETEQQRRTKNQLPFDENSFKSIFFILLTKWKGGSAFFPAFCYQKLPNFNNTTLNEPKPQIRDYFMEQKTLGGASKKVN